MRPLEPARSPLEVRHLGVVVHLLDAVVLVLVKIVVLVLVLLVLVEVVVLVLVLVLLVKLRLLFILILDGGGRLRLRFRVLVHRVAAVLLDGLIVHRERRGRVLQQVVDPRPEGGERVRPCQIALNASGAPNGGCCLSSPPEFSFI